MTETQVAPGDYLDRLNAQHNEHLDAIAVVERAALDENRDITDAELAQIDVHRTAIDNLAPQIERFETIRRTRMDSAARGASTVPGLPVQWAADASTVQVVERSMSNVDPDAEPVFRSAGQAAAAIIDARRGNQQSADLVQRAIATQKTSDTPGLLPVPTIGGLRGFLNAPRRIVPTATRLPLPPSGLDMKRPRISQHTIVGKQGTTSASEKTDVPSQAMQVQFDTFRLNTYGGSVNISIQDVERTDPGALELVYQDLAQQYGVATEADMAAALVAGATTLTTLAANASLATLWQQVFVGAGTILSASGGYLPNVLYASVDQWARIGGATTPLNAQNGVATAVPTELTAVVGNIEVVVAPSLPNGTLILGRREALEYVEDDRAPIRLSVPEPRILGYEIAVYGYFAPFVAQPAAFTRLAAA